MKTLFASNFCHPNIRLSLLLFSCLISCVDSWKYTTEKFTNQINSPHRKFINSQFIERKIHLFEKNKLWLTFEISKSSQYVNMQFRNLIWPSKGSKSSEIKKPSVSYFFRINEFFLRRIFLSTNCGSTNFPLDEVWVGEITFRRIMGQRIVGGRLFLSTNRMTKYCFENRFQGFGNESIMLLIGLWNPQ